MEKHDVQRTNVLKRICQYICLGAVAPMIVLCSRPLGGFADQAYYFFATILSFVPGKIGGYLRTAFYRGSAEFIHWDVNIGFGTFFTKRTVRIDHNVGIGAYCLIGSAVIGPNCWIASRVSIPSGKRQHESSDQVRHNSTDNQLSQIRIGKETWIGEGAIIMADVGAHCVVGAGSVVVHPVADCQTVAGNPAKPIRKKTCISNT